MSSDQQIAANRLNAQRSTGPRTSAGKAKVSVNAMKHGLTARDVVLPNENLDEYESFRSDLLARLNPHDALEGTLAEGIVAYKWRLRRALKFEAALHRCGFQELLVRKAENSVVHSQNSNSNVLMMESLENRPCDDGTESLCASTLGRVFV